MAVLSAHCCRSSTRGCVRVCVAGDVSMCLYTQLNGKLAIVAIVCLYIEGHGSGCHNLSCSCN